MWTDNSFEVVKRAAIDHGYLRQLFPKARQVGRELQTGDIYDNNGRSFCANLDTHAWIDNATGEKGGDIISLVAARFGMSQIEAARYICREIGMDWPGHQAGESKPRPKQVPSQLSQKDEKVLEFRPMDPPEGDAGPDFAQGGREPSMVSAYRHIDGRLAFFICRYEARHENDRKLILPMAYGEFAGKVGWHRKMPPGERPLLGLWEMVSAVKSGGEEARKPVLIVEGEKAFEAARRLLGAEYHVLTWAGGSQAVGKSDWRMLDDWPAIYIWPDNDAAGQKAAEQIAVILNAYPSAKVYIITPPPGSPAGWDLADAEAEGWTL